MFAELPDRFVTASGSEVVAPEVYPMTAGPKFTVVPVAVIVSATTPASGAGSTDCKRVASAVLDEVSTYNRTQAACDVWIE